jgi:hypothetical protein
MGEKPGSRVVERDRRAESRGKLVVRGGLGQRSSGSRATSIPVATLTLPAPGAPLLALPLFWRLPTFRDPVSDHSTRL